MAPIIKMIVNSLNLFWSEFAETNSDRNVANSFRQTLSKISLKLTTCYFVYCCCHGDVVFQERTVQIRRERVGGLGLSVKGGAEHNLPVLISRIFKDQAGIRAPSSFVCHRQLSLL